jgi:hypothetical protein
MVTKFVVTSTEAGSGFLALESAHRFVSSFDPAMVLFDPIVQIPVGPVFHSVVQLGSDRVWIAVVAVGGHAPE